MISDLSIMLAGGITVPAYTTYVSRDYEYIINDCSPTIIIVSNDEQFNKVKNICERNTSIKKIFSFETLNGIEENSYFSFNELYKKNYKQEEVKIHSNLKGLIQLA